jgi:hypothetical protein
VTEGCRRNEEVWKWIKMEQVKNIKTEIIVKNKCMKISRKGQKERKTKQR